MVSELIARLRNNASSWRRADSFDARDPEAEASLAEEAADALSSVAESAEGEAVAWRISCPDDEIYGRGPDTVRFHPLSPDEIASGYTQQPLYTHPAPSGQAVQDTWFTDRALPVKAMSGDVEDNRVLRLHFRRPVTDNDRKSMCDALNLHQASLSQPQPLPLKDEVERVLDRIADEYGIPGPWDEKFKTAQSLARALLTRLRAGEQEGWKLVPSEPTEAMCRAGSLAVSQPDEVAAIVYKEMLAASPSVSEGGSRNG